MRNCCHGHLGGMARINMEALNGTVDWFVSMVVLVLGNGFLVPVLEQFTTFAKGVSE